MKPTSIKASLIAPCGINCGLCLAYQRQKNKCPGCRYSLPGKPYSCQNCIIVNCNYFTGNKEKFCYNCQSFPCQRLKRLDKRYRAKYGLSVLENLMSIKSEGIRNFICNERQKWRCIKCGELICMHRKDCPICGTEREIKKYL